MRKIKFQNPTGIQIFKNENFGEIRTCQVDNQIMFVGKDVATALGYKNSRKALLDHVDNEDKGTVTIRDAAYETRATVINESGLYALVLSSKYCLTATQVAASWGMDVPLEAGRYRKIQEACH